MKANDLARHYAKAETNLIELNPEALLKSDYVPFLSDLALIRYKFSRKKYKGGKKK